MHIFTPWKRESREVAWVDSSSLTENPGKKKSTRWVLFSSFSLWWGSIPPRGFDGFFQFFGAQRTDENLFSVFGHDGHSIETVEGESPFHDEGHVLALADGHAGCRYHGAALHFVPTDNSFLGKEGAHAHFYSSGSDLRFEFQTINQIAHQAGETQYGSHSRQRQSQ